MANLGISAGGIDASQFNSMKEYLQSFKENLNSLNGEVNLLRGGSIGDTISKNPSLANDKELANDLNILKGKVSVDSSLPNPMLKGIHNSQGLQGLDAVSDDLGAGKAAKSFESTLGNYINEVNNTQKQSERAMDTYVSGGKIDLHTVMIASEKANLSMQLTMQMRNKILQAYQEISRMPV